MRARGWSMIAGAVTLAVLIGVGVAWLLSRDPATVEIQESGDPVGSTSAAAGQRLQLPGEMYVYPDSAAATWVRAADASSKVSAISEKIADQPSARWFGIYSEDLTADVSTVMRDARTTNSVPVIVLYEPLIRGCEPTLSIDEGAPAAYLDRSNSFAEGIGAATAVVIIEPDSLETIGCVDAAEQRLRLETLTKAMRSSKALMPNALTYLDAGPVKDLSVAEMAGRLDAAGLAEARGLALNVAGFASTDDVVKYAEALNQELETEYGYRKPYVIDTSRNGAPAEDVSGSCNPTGARIGEFPRVARSGEGPELFVWVKTPGESDGDCGQAPGTTAGEFVPRMALEQIGEK
ncbi:MAG: glycoside hydrolase family 6 protein [Nocardioides sp.]